MSAVPTLHGGRERAATRIKLLGDPPSPIDPPAGCRFASRCAAADERCHAPQRLREIAPAHWVSCCKVDVVDGCLQSPMDAYFSAHAAR